MKRHNKKIKVVESSGLLTQTLTQIFTPEGRLKKGKGKVNKHVVKKNITETDKKEDIIEEEEEYDIPAFKGVLHEDKLTPTHEIEDLVKPIGILNVRKGTKWLGEVLLNYNNGINQWLFLHGAWGLMPDETEAFLIHYGLDFEIMGYKKDPRENRRFQYLRKFADEFTEDEITNDPDKDYDTLTYNIHTKLSDNVLEHYYVEEEPSDDDIDEEDEDDDEINQSNENASNANSSITTIIIDADKKDNDKDNNININHENSIHDVNQE